MSDNLVSVIMPAYKRADTITRAIRSALDQTYPHIEVIVVDDNSQDGTVGVVEAIGDDRILVSAHSTNQGGNAARRSAIERSSGRYLAFLDADDVWHPDKITAQLERLTQAGPTHEFAYTWYESELPDGSIVPARTPCAEGLAAPELLRSNVIGTFSTALVTRAAYERAGGLDPSLPSCQDWDFYLRVNQVTGIACVPHVLARYWRGDDDPHRISSSRERVAAGHAEIFRRIEPLLRNASREDAVAARRYLMETVADQGATARLLDMARRIPRDQWSPGAARFVTHMALRSVRRTLASPRP